MLPFCYFALICQFSLVQSFCLLIKKSATYQIGRWAMTREQKHYLITNPMCPMQLFQREIKMFDIHCTNSHDSWLCVHVLVHCPSSGVLCLPQSMFNFSTAAVIYFNSKEERFSAVAQYIQMHAPANQTFIVLVCLGL